MGSLSYCTCFIEVEERVCERQRDGDLDQRSRGSVPSSTSDAL